MRCDIIMPVWNELECTRECVESIIRCTDYPYRLIAIDNGSDEATRVYLEGLKALQGLDYILIRNEKNLGFVKAVNQGIKSSLAPYVCIMNNDTVATKGWLAEMVQVMKNDPALGLVNPSSNTSGQFPQKSQPVDEYSSTLKSYIGMTQELYTCRGFCMLLSRAVIEKVGLFDESYGLGYFEETDYCRRAHEKGFLAACAKAAYVFHKERKSFDNLEDREGLFRANEKIFYGRWGRPVRIGYFVDDAAANEKVDVIATDAARSGHQILIFLKKGLPWPVRIDHFDIRKVDLGALFFGFSSFYQIVKRKKKKKLELLLTDNRLFGAVLRMAGIIHGGRVIIGPRRDAVLNAISEKRSLA